MSQIKVIENMREFSKENRDLDSFRGQNFF
jgi:hypothetical protein